MMNRHLLHDLTEMGLWSPALKNKIIYENGSVSKIPEIPEQLKAIYKYGYLHLHLHPIFCSTFVSFHAKTELLCDTRTVWEIKQKTLVDMAADRGCYIDQSQSLNIHMEQPDFGKLTSLHFHAWSKVRCLYLFCSINTLHAYCSAQLLINFALHVSLGKHYRK